MVKPLKRNNQTPPEALQSTAIYSMVLLACILIFTAPQAYLWIKSYHYFKTQIELSQNHTILNGKTEETKQSDAPRSSAEYHNLSDGAFQVYIILYSTAIRPLDQKLSLFPKPDIAISKFYYIRW